MALRSTRRLGVCALAFVGFTAAIGSGTQLRPEPVRHVVNGVEGADTRLEPSSRPAVEAAFTAESYPPRAQARLRITSDASDVTVQLFHAGTESTAIGARDVMLGDAVNALRRLGRVRGPGLVRVRIGAWPSGLYFARLTASGGRVGYAPFLLRSARLGTHRVAVVLPTFTWQAYNFRDDDRDGDADTWYADAAETVRLARPYENRGVPPHYKFYDQPFLRWLVRGKLSADFLSDTDLDRIGSGRTLARAYELIVFPGHHEYVTRREFDAVVEFRNLGGNLAFLSANNFFWRVDRTGRTLRRVARWRDLGRPEAALVGVQYLANDRGRRKSPWVVRDARAAPWLFAGTGLVNGSSFSRGGVEIDATTRSSPRGIRVLADIRNLFGLGRSAQMTYYETRSGAKVFAAGAFMLVRDLRRPRIARLMTNLWSHLAVDEDVAAVTPPVPGGRALPAQARTAARRR